MAPYIVTRYDPITGEIIPLDKRVGFLDRKLHRVAEQAITEKEFIKWSKIAYESSYGYELQGDHYYWLVKTYYYHSVNTIIINLINYRL